MLETACNRCLAMREPLVKFWRRIHLLVRSRRRKRNINEALRFQVQQRKRDPIATRMSKDEADGDAGKCFGNWQSPREDGRAIREILWPDYLFQDFSFGFRILIKQPGSLLAALAALTLGIGLVTVMFSAINTLMLRSLPLPDPERLISTTVPAWAVPEFRKQQTTFEGLVSFGDFHANFRSAGAPSRREACFISANFLDIMRAKPLLGRSFRPGEDASGAEAAAILSYKLWQEEFQGNRAVLGSTVWVEGSPKTVVGVMPAEFRFPINDDLWIAAEVTPAIANRDTGFVFGRLKPDVTLAGARAELNTIWTRLQPPRRNDERPVEQIRAGAYVDALTGALYGRNTIGSAILGMLLVTLFVLFLACANVAMLTLGRAVKRGREFAIRGALGATRRRLVFQLLAENLLLFTGGAVGGTLAAGCLLHWLLARMPSDTTHWRLYASWWHFEIDGHVLFLVACLIFLTNLVAGLWPCSPGNQAGRERIVKGPNAPFLPSGHRGIPAVARNFPGLRRAGHPGRGLCPHPPAPAP